jgi:hypothetical protein
MATRKSKGIYRKWKEEDLHRALGAVKDGVGVNEYVHVVSDCNEAEGETRAATVDFPYVVLHSIIFYRKESNNSHMQYQNYTLHGTLVSFISEFRMAPVLRLLIIG